MGLSSVATRKSPFSPNNSITPLYTTVVLSSPRAPYATVKWLGTVIYIYICVWVCVCVWARVCFLAPCKPARQCYYSDVRAHGAMTSARAKPVLQDRGECAVPLHCTRYTAFRSGHVSSSRQSQPDYKSNNNNDILFRLRRRYTHGIVIIITQLYQVARIHYYRDTSSISWYIEVKRHERPRIFDNIWDVMNILLLRHTQIQWQ